VAPNRIVAPRRRQEISQATLRCLARDGYDRLTMKALAAEAGVSQGILHYYFQDKIAILIAALEAVSAELEQRLAQDQAHASLDAAQRLRAVIETCLTTAVERPEIWRVYLQFWGEMLHDPRLAARNAALYTKMRRQMAGLLTQGIRAGVFRRVNVTQAAAVIVGLMDGVALQLTFDPPALPLNTAVHCCYEAVARYLQP
jgi:AcrR family transcriptional regulator